MAASTDLEFHCSIVHHLPIASDRKIFSAAYNSHQQDDEYEEVCIIASVTINNTGASVAFPAHRSLELFYPTIPFIGPNLFRQFNVATVNLELRKGILRELYYGLSRLESLKISATGLKTFDVLPVQNDKLHTLVIHERNMTTLPGNIRYLVGLKLLDVSNCALKTVDLNSLENLAALNVLSVAYNDLTSVTVGGELILPNLAMFDVRQNRLQQIDRFPDMFPGLKSTRLMKNRWDCDWVSAVRAAVWQRKITVLGNDFLCDGRVRNGGLCCSYSSPERARVAISELMLTALDELPEREAVVRKGFKLQVFENETFDGVIGVEMEKVGVYLQDPINKV